MGRWTAVIAVVALLALAAPALANPVAPCFGSPDPGTVGIYFNTAGTLACADIQPFIPFDYYVMGHDLEGDVFGYEFEVMQDPRVLVLSRTPNPPTAFDVGPGADNWIVGTGQCISGVGPVALVTMQGMITAPGEDILLCVTASTPSAFTPPVPNYLTCLGAADLRPFEVAIFGLGYYPDSCAVGNPTSYFAPIAVEATSWGTLKAGYEN